NRIHPADGRSFTSSGTGLLFKLDEGVVHKAVEVRTRTEPVVYDATLVWTAELAPRERWEACLEVIATLGEEVLVPRFRCHAADAVAVPEVLLASWRASLPEVDTDSAALAQAIRRAGEDLGALRIFDPEHPDLPILAAGAPWFMTVFGRDSLLTAW